MWLGYNFLTRITRKRTLSFETLLMWWGLKILRALRILYGIQLFIFDATRKKKIDINHEYLYHSNKYYNHVPWLCVEAAACIYCTSVLSRCTNYYTYKKKEWSTTVFRPIGFSPRPVSVRSSVMLWLEAIQPTPGPLGGFITCLRNWMKADREMERLIGKQTDKLRYDMCEESK